MSYFSIKSKLLYVFFLYLLKRRIFKEKKFIIFVHFGKYFFNKTIKFIHNKNSKLLIKNNITNYIFQKTG
jgi:hypothetical protein